MSRLSPRARATGTRSLPAVLTAVPAVPTVPTVLTGLAVGTTALGLVLLPATAASAHVRVFPDTTTAGGFAELTFRVPTESDTASTVAVRVELPTDTPLTSVRTRPLPGWTAVVERGPLPTPVVRDGATLTEAPTAVVWTAQPGAGVGPGQYQELALTVGPLPEAGTEVVLPATQTYSDGESVAWSQRPLADGTEPELPAPVLVTTEAAVEGADHAAATGTAADGSLGDDAPAAAEGAAAAPDGSRDAADGPARWLGGGGLALGAAALVTSLVRRRGPAAGAAAPAPAA